MTEWAPITEAVLIEKNRVSEFDGGKRYLATGDLDENIISGYTMVNYASRPSRADLVVEDGNILVARMKATNKVLLINDETRDLIVSTGFLVLRPKTSFIAEFLYYFIKSVSFQQQKDKLCSGSTQKAINNSAFKEIKVPRVSLENQNRLVKDLKVVDNLCQKRKAQIKFSFFSFQTELCLLGSCQHKGGNGKQYEEYYKDSKSFFE